MQEYPYEETISSQINHAMFWNWKTNQFDEIGTEFCFEDHVNDRYYSKEQQQLIKDVLACGDNHYLATIIEGDDSDDPFVFSPGYHFVNRIGYVVYKSLDKLPQDYWV